MRLAHYTSTQGIVAEFVSANTSRFPGSIAVIRSDVLAIVRTTFTCQAPMSSDFTSPFTVRAPATSANMGPGFDCIGIALDIWNTTTVLPGEGDSQIEGEGSEFLPSDGSNLIYESALKAFDAIGSPPVPFHFASVNDIPCARGIGSSSAAVATGVAIAMQVSGEDVCADDTKIAMLEVAANIEGHPDNVAPAIFGSCQIGYRSKGAGGHLSWRAQQVEVSDDLRAVLFVPDFLMHTDSARGILADEVKRADAVFNVGRASLLTYALVTGEYHLLREGTEDRLHQPQRVAAMFPRYNVIARAALDAGALGVFLSGAGPTILALATDRQMTISYEMAEAARKASVDGYPLVASLSRRGLAVTNGVASE